MGQAHSNRSEKKAYDGVIRHIPGFGGLYSLFRAAVYGGKNEKKEAEWSGKNAASPWWGYAERDVPEVFKNVLTWGGKKGKKVVQDKLVQLKTETKTKAKENAGLIAAVTAAVAVAAGGLWYWSNRRKAAAERAREERTRAIFREELERVNRGGILRRRLDA